MYINVKDFPPSGTSILNFPSKSVIVTTSLNSLTLIVTPGIASPLSESVTLPLIFICADEKNHAQTNAIINVNLFIIIIF